MENNWINVYDDFAKNHTDAISQAGYMIDGKPISKTVFDNWFANIQNKFIVSQNDRLIDVGCGSGIFLNYFAQHTQELYGVDTSQEQINNAKKNCSIATLKQGDALNFDMNNVLFDRIFCNSVFLLFESLVYAEKVLTYFLDNSTQNAKIWIGDLPKISDLVDSNYRRVGKSSPLGLQHYPENFLLDFCEINGLKGEVIYQNVPDKPTAIFRYDFLITK